MGVHKIDIAKHWLLQISLLITIKYLGIFVSKIMKESKIWSYLMLLCFIKLKQLILKLQFLVIDRLHILLLILSEFNPINNFHSPWNYHRTINFLMILGRIELMNGKALHYTWRNYQKITIAEPCYSKGKELGMHRY